MTARWRSRRRPRSAATLARTARASASASRPAISTRTAVGTTSTILVMLVTSGDGRPAGRERCALAGARPDCRAGAAAGSVVATRASAPCVGTAALTAREWPRDRVRGERRTARGPELWTVDFAGAGVATAAVATVGAAATTAAAAGALAGVLAGAVSGGAVVAGVLEPVLGALPDVPVGCVERALLRFADSCDRVGSAVASLLDLVVELCGLAAACVSAELAGSVPWVACAAPLRDLPALCCDASSRPDCCPPVDSRPAPARRWPGGWLLASGVALAAAGALLGVGALALGWVVRSRLAVALGMNARLSAQQTTATIAAARTLVRRAGVRCLTLSLIIKRVLRQPASAAGRWARASASSIVAEI